MPPRAEYLDISKFQYFLVILQTSLNGIFCSNDLFCISKEFFISFPSLFFLSFGRNISNENRSFPDFLLRIFRLRFFSARVHFLRKSPLTLSATSEAMAQSMKQRLAARGPKFDPRFLSLFWGIRCCMSESSASKL